MPQKKTSPKIRVKKRNIILIALVVIISLVILGVIGKLIIDDIAKRQEINQQKATLNKTLRDMTVVYDRFVSDSNGSLEKTIHEPKNECSEISSKGTAKLYTCGTRADLRFSSGDEAKFRLISGRIPSSVTEAFLVKKIYNIKEDGLYNGLSMQANLIHKESGQMCYIFGNYYREQERFTLAPNEIRYSFDCNLNTRQPIFEVED